MRGQRAAVGTIKQRIMRASTKRGYVCVRNFILTDQGWIPLARFNWIQAHGAIPPASEVIHRVPPPDVPCVTNNDPAKDGKKLRYRSRLEFDGPPDVSVDDISNLALVPRGGLVEKIRINKTSARKQRNRRRIAVTRSNQRRCQVADALYHIKPHRWYPVRVDARLVVMRSSRTCKAARGVIETLPSIAGPHLLPGEKIIPLRGDEIMEEPGLYHGFGRFVPEIGDGDDDGDSFPLADSPLS